MKTITRISVLVLFLAVLAGPVWAEEFEKNYTFPGDELIITNLIGKVEVQPTGGDRVLVTVMVRGDDAEPELLEFEVEDGRKGELHIKFPTDDHSKYVYPAMGSGSKTSISYKNEEGGSWLKKIMGGNRITVRGKGSGLEMWADVLVEVPRDKEVEIKLGVGNIEASDVKSDLVLDTQSGPIDAINITGELVCDTGSGRVTAADINGNLVVDTGSGSVDIADCEGAKILVDTGSGKVNAERISCSDLTIDTGSGRVKAREIEADNAKIDTGSGSVVFQLDRMGDGRFVVDTGSGSIEVDLPDDASASITADTGSGSMNCDLQGAMIKHKSRREMSLVVGDGDARMILDAGSGSVTVK